MTPLRCRWIALRRGATPGLGVAIERHPALRFNVRPFPVVLRLRLGLCRFASPPKGANNPPTASYEDKRAKGYESA